MAESVNGDTHRLILRFYARHRLRDLMLSGRWTEDQVTDALVEYAKLRPNMTMGRLAESFRADVLAWQLARGSDADRSMMRYVTVETEP